MSVYKTVIHNIWVEMADYYLILYAKIFIIAGFPTLPFALSHGKGID